MQGNYVVIRCVESHDAEQPKTGRVLGCRLFVCTASLLLLLCFGVAGAQANGGDPPANTLAPSISGTAEVGQELTADPGTWTGTPTPTFAYQWQSCVAGDGNSSIFGTPAGDPQGIALDAAGNVYTSNANTDNVTKITPAGVSSTLGATGDYPIAIALDAAGNVYTANYESSNVTKINSGFDCSNITDATSSTYTLKAADYDSYIRAKVTATNAVNPDGVAFSQISGQIQGVAPQNTLAPSISGTAEVGQELTADPGTWTGTPTPTFAYQWQSCDQTAASCSNITDATSSTYTLTSTDQGSTIKVRVTATNSEASEDSTSPATAAVTGSGTAKPKLRLKLTNFPAKIRAGRAFTAKASLKNRVGEASASSSDATSSAAWAKSVKTCLKLPKSIFAIKAKGAKRSGRTLCWSKSAMATGKSVSYRVKLKTSRKARGRVLITATATAASASGTKVKAASKKRIKLLPARGS